MGSLSTGRLASRRWSAAGPRSKAVSFSAGPMVRTRFPPAASQQRTVPGVGVRLSSAVCQFHAHKPGNRDGKEQCVVRPPDERFGSCLTKERPEAVSQISCQIAVRASVEIFHGYGHENRSCALWRGRTGCNMRPLVRRSDIVGAKQHRAAGLEQSSVQLLGSSEFYH